MNCKILEKNIIPEGLYECNVKEVDSLLGGPTLLHIEGEINEPLYISALLHGNETTSFRVVQRLLRDFKKQKPSRDIVIFLGNTKAASLGVRQVPGQIDYNRIWEDGDLPENRMAQSLVRYLTPMNLFASIDIHNNTGNNPFYSCVNNLKPEFLALASQFGDHSVYFSEPHNVQSMYFSKLCPSVTIEAGLPGDEEGIDAVYNYVKKIMSYSSLSEIDYSHREEVFHSLARIKIAPDAQINFLESKLSPSEDISFLSNLDDKNFDIIRSRTFLGYADSLKNIEVLGENGENLVHEFFAVEEGRLITQRTFIPSMLTKNIEIVKSDCLGYVMEVLLPSN